jgi:alkylated DNA repair protein alkB family protein 6
MPNTARSSFAQSDSEGSSTINHDEVLISSRNPESTGLGDAKSSLWLLSHSLSGSDGLPTGCYYAPNFITAEEEQQISSVINATPASKWTNLSHRRLLSLPGLLTGTARDTLIAAPLPQYLQDPILSRLRETKVFISTKSPHGEPNHVLINEYQPGQGIMPHEDGPAYFPVTATVSLGSHTVLEIYKKNEQGERESSPTWRILQEPRSLLVTSESMYTNTLHGIANISNDEDLRDGSITNWHALADKTPYESGRCERQTRISLTYRDVLRVMRLGGALNFLGKK